MSLKSRIQVRCCLNVPPRIVLMLFDMCSIFNYAAACNEGSNAVPVLLKLKPGLFWDLFSAATSRWSEICKHRRGTILPLGVNPWLHELLRTPPADTAELGRAGGLCEVDQTSCGLPWE